MGRHLQVNPAAADLGSGTPTATTVLTPNGWTEFLDFADGVSFTKTFYTASSSGGTVNVLNTVTIENGVITAWTQTTSGGGALQFDDPSNSVYPIVVGM